MREKRLLLISFRPWSCSGQPTVVKIEAFPFTPYGVIHGHVKAVATDAIPEPDANQLEGDPSKQLQATVPTTNVQRVQNLVFPMPSSSTTAP
jgi:hemolysin D